MPLNTEHIKRQIQYNCDISDARYGGRFSVCGLLLRLRNLYKWEKRIPPWNEPEPADLLQWVDERESRWENLLDIDFQPIEINGESYHPLEQVESINQKLIPHGLIYGAGYGLRMKPSFFLGKLVSTTKHHELTIHIIDQELARDFFTTPAMRLGREIVARRSAMRYYLWDQIMEMRPSALIPLAFAFAQYGLDLKKLREKDGQYRAMFLNIADLELERFVFHEVGEARETIFNGGRWREIVAGFCGSVVEIYARALKDLLADTHQDGLIRCLVHHRHNSSLGLYLAFMSPFSKMLFPQIERAVDQFRKPLDWNRIEAARIDGYRSLSERAIDLLRLYDQCGRTPSPETEERIVKTLIKPLGIL